MDRAEAIKEKLVELLVESPGLDSLYGEWERDADFLIANGVTVQEWISVKERLPEACVKVLTSRKNGHMEENWQLIGGGWYSDGICNPVTHWMPLPEPPKEGAE